ncbi:MAG: hypothetical protein JRF48_13575 [Deltaproteobacteria bacterium]|nr:hypothetical protein [Deltaproteobacteria bacterium]
MTEMLNVMFGAAPEKKLFVGGCSAGGAGAIVNYYFLRTGIDGVQQGYLLNDSGPIYPSTAPTSRSRFLHDEVRSVWDADSLIAKASHLLPARLQLLPVLLRTLLDSRRGQHADTVRG